MGIEEYRSQTNKKGDFSILLISVGLALFGLLMISSASVVVSYETFGSNYVYLSKQAIALFIGLIGMMITAVIDYRKWKDWAVAIFILSILLILSVYIFGVDIRGAKRWLDFGIILLQPSEIMKLSFIIYISAWLQKKHKDITSLSGGVIPFAILVIMAIFLIMQQRDMGTALIIAISSLVMFVVAGASFAHVTMGGLVGVFMFSLLIRSADYRWQRFLTFLNPKSDIQGAGYQINQAMIAIGTGGWLGLGFGQSKQKYLYLPLAQTDAIFAIMVEELGFIRVLIVLLAILYFGLKGFQIASGVKDIFGKLLATGITSWIMFQALINIGGIMGLIPLTGIPLPFISYGGSSLVVLLTSVGILYNISRFKEK